MSLTQKYRRMPFMLRYAQNFEKSQIIEKILPRKLGSAEHLRQEFPYLLNEGSSQANKDMQPTTEGMYKEADFKSINKGLCEPIYDLLDRGGK